MDYVYALLGFMALIVLHEAGHFTAAKAVGMRVERFCLFFPPLVFKVRRGETEYGIGAIPLGGYVKITGMSPREEIAPELLPRAYYNQAVWKRIVVIAAGPMVNIVLAIVIVWVLLLSSTDFGHVTSTVGAVTARSPAAHVLRAGDRIISADGVRGEAAIRERIAGDRCANGARVQGCQAQTPVQLLVRRGGRLIHVPVRPTYATLQGESGMFIGIDFHLAQDDFLQAGSASISSLWHVATASVSAIARIFEPKERKQLSGVVGTYDVTAQSFHNGAAEAIYVLALISLSLGVINLFPFLPLDGGHIFWAVAEKVRGRQIPFAVMERAGIVGFVLILALFVIGLSNDVTNIAHGTFNR